MKFYLGPKFRKCFFRDKKTTCMNITLFYVYHKVNDSPSGRFTNTCVYMDNPRCTLFYRELNPALPLVSLSYLGKISVQENFNERASSPMKSHCKTS